MRNPKSRRRIGRAMRAMVIAAAAVAGCSTAPAGPPVGPLACPIIGSDSWGAWVRPAAAGQRATLLVTGRVTVPTGGYRFEWRDMRVMESYPVQVAVELAAIPPAGPATQALVTHDVRGEWPIDPPVGALTVRCGDMVLVRISPVETAH